MSLRRALLTLMVVVGCVGSVTSQAKNDATGAPKLVIVKTDFNAGEVKEGSVVKHTFPFRNDGTASLEIKNVVLTCGCETVDYDKTVAPGKDGKITLLVRTEGATGAQSKLVVVTTNDAQKPSFDLVMHLTVISDTKKPAGQIAGPFVISPSTQISRSVTLGTAPDFAVTVYSSGTPAARITKVVSEGSKFSFSLEPTADGTRYVVRGTAPTPLPLGRYSQAVTLVTDNKEMPEIKLEFDATVVLPLRISPQHLVFDRVVSFDGAPPRASKFVWVMQSGGPAFELKGVQSTLPFLTLERSENSSTSTFILRALFTAIPPKGTHTGKIVVMTNLASQPQFEVQVTVNVP